MRPTVLPWSWAKPDSRRTSMPSFTLAAPAPAARRRTDRQANAEKTRRGRTALLPSPASGRSDLPQDQRLARSRRGRQVVDTSMDGPPGEESERQGLLGLGMHAEPFDRENGDGAEEVPEVRHED